MNFEYFIAKRLVQNQGKGKASSAISKIGVLSIAIGMSMMLIAVSTGKGLQNTIKDKLVAFNGNIEIFYYDGNNSEVATRPIRLSDSLLLGLQQIKGVDYVAHTATKGGIVRTENNFEGVLAKGVDSNYIDQNIKTYLKQGRLPDFSKKISNEVVISSYLSNRLQLDLGDRFQILFFKKNNNIPSQRYMRVVGIYNSGFEEFDSSYIFIDIRHIQRINRWKKNDVGTLEVFIDNLENTSIINAQIYEYTPSNMDTRTIIDKYGVIMEWLHLMDYNIYIIIIIMIAVGGVNMITTMLVIILDRVRLIGILKALGANQAMVRKVFLYQAVYLVGLGLIFGNLIGLGLLYFQSKFGLINLNPSIYYVSTAPVDINFYDIILLNTGTMALCVLMLIIPAHLTTRISPIKVLKID